MVCDFCSAPNPSWSFEARVFATEYGNIIAMSDSRWAACDACCALIQANDREGLLDRGVQLVPEIPEMREWVRLAHNSFFEHQVHTPPARIETPVKC